MSELCNKPFNLSDGRKFDKCPENIRLNCIIYQGDIRFGGNRAIPGVIYDTSTNDGCVLVLPSDPVQTSEPPERNATSDALRRRLGLS